MPVLQEQARQGMSVTDYKLVFYANTRSATRFGHNIPHAVFETSTVTT
jgi:hypothetical protein